MSLLNHVADQLASNQAAFAALFHGVWAAWSEWQPAPEAWSLRDVAGHLYDEERFDFRARLRLTLEDPNQPWPAIEPERWVIERRAAAITLQDAVAGFQAERSASIAWLRSLSDPPLLAAHDHHVGGQLVVRAGDLLSNWLAHDHLHLRQINELKYAWLVRSYPEWDVRYAGDW